MSNDSEGVVDAILKKVRRLLREKKTGPSLVDDLQTGLSAMPIWMQDTLRELLSEAQEG